MDPSNLPKQLKDLKYWKLYPKEVREWVFSSRQTVGLYDDEGVWRDYTILGANRPDRRVDRAQAKLKMREQVPYDLAGAYRFGITPQEAKALPEKVKRILSFEYAKEKEISAFRKKKIIERWGRHPRDTGSPEVTIACLSEKIRALTFHLGKHPQDKHSARGLQAMIVERTQAMKYLKRTDINKYYELLHELGLKDIIKLNMFPMPSALAADISIQNLSKRN